MKPAESSVVGQSDAGPTPDSELIPHCPTSTSVVQNCDHGIILNAISSWDSDTLLSPTLSSKDSSASGVFHIEGRTNGTTPPPLALPVRCEREIGILLGHQLGQGAYGRVYSCTSSYSMEPTKEFVVKVLNVSPWTSCPEMITPHAILAEAVLSKSLIHKNIVTTYDYAFVQRASWSNLPVVEMWILQEKADMGTLYDGIRAGLFKDNLSAVVFTALDIARGIRHLHEVAGVIHADLSGNNILLKTADTATTDAEDEIKDKRGFNAVICDLGLSTMTKAFDLSSGPPPFQTCALNKPLGTVTHLAPELLVFSSTTHPSTKGVAGAFQPSKPQDIYGFGVLLWELFNNQLAWKGYNSSQIIFSVGWLGQTLDDGLQEQAPCPPELRQLVKDCMHANPDARPTISSIIETLLRHI